MHQRKQLQYPIEQGLGDFLSPAGLKMLAVDYQQGLLDRLNEQVRGTELENKSVVQTVIEAARDPHKVLEFNYASEALNNSFFLESLKPPPNDEKSHQGVLNNALELMSAIRTDFGSLEQLKSDFSAAALGMFSSGWLWLICDNTGSLAIYPTFGSGSLLVRSSSPLWESAVGEIVARQVRNKGPSPTLPSSERTTTATASSPTSGLSHPPSSMNPPTQSRTYSTPSFVPRPASVYGTNAAASIREQKADHTKVGQVLFPLLCVSVHERSWVGAGYGVWGKEEYLKRFWSVVDWAQVNDKYLKRRRQAWNTFV